MLHYIVLYCTVLYDILVYHIISYHIISYYIIVYHSISYYIIWHYITLCPGGRRSGRRRRCPPRTAPTSGRPLAAGTAGGARMCHNAL